MRPFRPLRALAALSGVLALTQLAAAATYDWTGASGTDLLWSTPGNWLPAGPPAAGGQVRFRDAGATNDTVAITSIVSANTTLNSLWVGPTSGLYGAVTAAHNLLIQPGVTLTIAGTTDNGYGTLGSGVEGSVLDPNVQSTFYVGTKTNVAPTTTVSNTISGGGTLVLDNPNNELNVRQIISGTTGGSDHLASLDLSGLDTFVASLGRIRIGDGESEPIRRATGKVYLAQTNTLTLTGPNVAENVQLVVGNNDVNNNGGGEARTSELFLGKQTTLQVDEILVGGRKTEGHMQFNPKFIAPALRLRGSNGSNRVSKLRIGDHSNQLNTGNSTLGIVDLSAGTVDALVDTVFVGRSSAQQTGPATGILTLGPGTLDADTIEVAFQTIDQNTTSTVTGTLNVNGTTVVANKLLRLGRSAGAAAARNATLNINGGSVTVNGSYKNEGTVTININSGLLALPSNSAVVASSLNLDGGTISNAATIRVTNTLTIANSGVIAGNPVFDMGNTGSATWDVQGASGGGLTVSNGFEGSGSFSGNLIQAPAATFSPGGSGAGTLNLAAGNLTLNGGVLRFDLSTNGLGVNDQITVSGTLALNATNDVNLRALGGVFDTASPYTLMTAGTLVGNQSHFRVAGALAQSRYTFAFDTTSTPNSVKLAVGGTGPANLTWVGDDAANIWDLKGATNWSDGAAASQFFSLDAVTFDDTGSASPVRLVGPLTPGSIAVTNQTKNYAFNGNGDVLGAALTKAGAGSLTFANIGNASFGGPVTVQSGAVTFGNDGLNTFANGLAVNGGSVAFAGGSTNSITGGALTIGFGASLIVSNANENVLGSGLIDLDGTLIFNQAVDATLDGILSGGGTLIKGGANTLTLGSDNSALSTVVQINAGTVKAGSSGALGSVGVTIADGGALNLNGQNLATIAVTGSGSGPGGGGAVVNTGGAQPNALANLTLTGNTTFGGSGPWRTDPVLNAGLWAIVGALSTSNQPYHLTKVGLNQVALTGTTVDPALGDIDVQAGMLSFDGDTDSMGNPTNTLTVRAGATLSFFNSTTAWDKKFVLFGDGVTPTLHNWAGANTIKGPVTLNGNCVVSAPPPERGAPVSLTVSGPVGGRGALNKSSADTLILSGASTYTGETVVDAGTLALTGVGSIPSSSSITINADATLDASGRTDATLTLASGQILKGNGTVSGNLNVGGGATLSPGTSVGVLTISGTVVLRGTTHMELNKANGTNDLIRGAASMDYGGVLSVTNLAGTLAGGDRFRLFSAGAYNGSFAIVPTTPGPGLTWDVSSLLVDGTLKIAGDATPAPEIEAVTVSGGNIAISGTGGPANRDYFVLTATNVALPLINWTRLQTNRFDTGGSFGFTNAVDSNVPQQFFLLQLP